MSVHISFQEIYDRAVDLKGEENLLAQLPKPKSSQALIKISDSAYLAEMCKCIFRSGFVWQIVEAKWTHFEKAFGQFNPGFVAGFSDEKLEQLAQDASIIRNLTKIKATRENAMFILEVAEKHSSFGRFLAEWPEDDLVGLLLHLRKYGSRLGGHTGQYFLRFMGKDSFIFSKDVVAVLVMHGIVDKEPTSKKGLHAVQQAFNTWREETGLAYSQLSRIMAASIPAQD